jgi:hypothetical protein
MTDYDFSEEPIVCAPGNFPGPGLVVATDLAARDSRYFHRLGIVSFDGRSVAIRDSNTGNYRSLSIGSIVLLATCDLDADGTDEILAIFNDLE